MRIDDALAPSLAAAFGASGFGERVVFTAPGRDPVEVDGIFDRDYQELLLESGGTVSTNRVAVDLILAAVAPAVPRGNSGQTVTVRGKPWAIVDAQENGDGTVTCVLTTVARTV